MIKIIYDVIVIDCIYTYVGKQRMKWGEHMLTFYITE